MRNLGRRGFAGALLFWIMPAASAAGALALAPLLALCGAIGAPWRFGGRIPLAYALLLAAAAWAALSVLWSPLDRPEQALKIVLATMAGLGLVAGMSGLDEKARGWVRASLLAGLLMLALLLAIEAGFDMPFNRAAQPETPTGLLQRNPGRGVFVLEALGFAGLAAALMLRGPPRWVFGAILLAAMAALSTQFSFDANLVAFAIGLAAFALGYAAPRWAPALAAGVWAFWLMAAPWVIHAASGPLREAALQLPPSWGMRLQIWDYAAARAIEKPLLGWGLDASRSFRDPQDLNGFTYAAIPLHPHSFSVQVWLETGGVGALLLAASLAATGLACVRWCDGARLPAAAATACIATIGLVWNVSYGAWQEWYMALPFMAAAAVLALKRA
ncbi:MAG: O-antigen ligase family protein [Hyphomonadaceae bacterium]|nr:O-antigen ligase family protein [Hyphomonadaceae bacterium]